jgi:DNA repair exonuclease SbcCD ATPase subunit
MMADPSVSPETPNVAEVAGFLRRFGDLMSNGYNAAFLHRAADLLEVLTTRVIAASDEEDLSRYKYETLSQHADALEAECDALKRDIEGHVHTASSILTERDALKATLRSRESDLSELRGALTRKSEELATALQAREAALARLQAAFDGERETLKAMIQAGAGELEQVRRAVESEREQHAATLRAREAELSELRLAFDRERLELEAQLKTGADELAALQVASQGERDTLQEKVAALEAKRAELRSAFDRISDLRNQTNEPAVAIAADERPALVSAASPFPASPVDQNPAVGETDAIVPKTTLRQARAQFEYLAKEFIPLGDIASRVMCELGAYTMDLALAAGQQVKPVPVDEVALDLLSSSSSVPLRAGSNPPAPA